MISENGFATKAYIVYFAITKFKQVKVIFI
jgi:hypothetical protein